MTKSTFTAEEVKTALVVRDDIIKTNIEELKSVYMAGEIVMWHTETASLQSENESLRAALKELVALRDMKIKMDDKTETGRLSVPEFLIMEADYRKRKPLAWEQARKISNQKK